MSEHTPFQLALGKAFMLGWHDHREYSLRSSLPFVPIVELVSDIVLSNPVENAAPELLALAEQLVNRPADMGTQELGDWLCPILEQARDAIAKAKGEN